MYALCFLETLRHKIMTLLCITHVIIYGIFKLDLIGHSKYLK